MTTSADLPAIGSVWEWRQGDPQTREVVTVLEATPTPAAVLIRGTAGQRWVPLTAWMAYATAPPLKGHTR